MNVPVTRKKFEQAFALLAMLASLVVILIVFSGVMFWVSTNSKQTKRNQQFTASEAAAEGASRAIYQCQNKGYRLPPERYSDWSEINPLRFDPRQMMNQ